MILHLGGTFLEPDGRQGTYELNYYEVIGNDEIILGAVFSIPTFHKGVEVHPHQVLAWGDLDVYDATAVRRCDAEQVYRKAGKVYPRPPYVVTPGAFVELFSPKPTEQQLVEPEAVDSRPLEPVDAQLAEALGTVPSIWIEDVLSRFDSEESMLQTLWVAAPDVADFFSLKSKQKLPAKVPYTKEQVTLERAFRADFKMYEGWFTAIQNACINEGVCTQIATAIAHNFMDDSFGVMATDLDAGEEPAPGTWGAYLRKNT